MMDFLLKRNTCTHLGSVCLPPSIVDVVISPALWSSPRRPIQKDLLPPSQDLTLFTH